MTDSILMITGLFLGLIIGWLIASLKQKRQEISAEEELNKASEEVKKAQIEAKAIITHAKASAKEEKVAIRDEFEKETRDTRRELQKLESRLSSREGNLDKRSDSLDKRHNDVERREQKVRESEEEFERFCKQREQQLNEQEVELKGLINKQVSELERVAGLDREEAKRQLLATLEGILEGEKATLIRRYQEEMRDRVEDEGREIMVSAMQRYANDCAYERTTSTIPLPNEEIKGRIIGREGRNIRAIEAATGVSVLIDDTPDAVVISCFDSVRREIARQVMERLLSDGRIHPARIEDMVKKVTKEIDAEMQKAGQETVDDMGITRLNRDIIKMIGRLKFRYSFSQNVLMHSIEVASLMGNIAAEIGIDEQKARRAGLLHDLGKAVDHEIEGSHAVIGANILKRNGEDEEVINAVAAHHEDVEKNSLLAVLVEICDTLSAGRPGARSETTDLYLKRLENLEEIGNSFRGVEQCFAIQAGRELRVLVKPGEVSEDVATNMAREMAERIEQEMRYPGQIRVSIIRETRFTEYAK